MQIFQNGILLKQNAGRVYALHDTYTLPAAIGVLTNTRLPSLATYLFTLQGNHIRARIVAIAIFCHICDLEAPTSFRVTLPIRGQSHESHLRQ